MVTIMMRREAIYIGRCVGLNFKMFSGTQDEERFIGPRVWSVSLYALRLSMDSSAAAGTLELGGG